MYVLIEVTGLSEEDDSGDKEDGPLDDVAEEGAVTGKRKKKQSTKSSKRRSTIVPW